TKYKKVIRSVLISKLYSIVNRFNSTIYLSATLNRIIYILSTLDIPLIVYIDLKFLYNYLVKLGTTNKKKLIIDIISL
ncbi:hypothetical protein DM02DRAFT_513155, partial [Periconia macrospinosa]